MRNTILSLVFALVIGWSGMAQPLENVKDYTACNGTGDDTAGFQLAVASGHGVYVPRNSRCILNGMIRITTQNFRLEGEGDTSVIHRTIPGPDPYFMVDGAVRFESRNLKILGTNSNDEFHTSPGSFHYQGNHGFVLSNTFRSKIVDVTFEALWGNGVVLTNGSSLNRVLDNHFINIGRHGVSIDSGSFNIVETNFLLDAGIAQQPVDGFELTANVYSRNQVLNDNIVILAHDDSVPGLVEGNTVINGQLEVQEGWRQANNLITAE